MIKAKSEAEKDDRPTQFDEPVLIVPVLPMDELIPVPPPDDSLESSEARPELTSTATEIDV